MIYFTPGRARRQRLSCLACKASPPRMAVRRWEGAFCSRTPELATRWKAEVAQTRAVTSFSSKKSMSRVGNRNAFLGMMWVVAAHFKVR